MLSTQLMTIENINRTDDDTPVSFDGIPPEWEIKPNQIKLHCTDGKPIELGRGGFGVVLFGDSSLLCSFFEHNPVQTGSQGFLAESPQSGTSTGQHVL